MFLSWTPVLSVVISDRFDVSDLSKHDDSGFGRSGFAAPFVAGALALA